MLMMRPIEEPEVVALLNDGRFCGEVEGYVVLEGSSYLGHALFSVEEEVATVLDTGVEEALNLDGVIRACVSAGERRGARCFAVNLDHPPLKNWWERNCKGLAAPVPMDHIFKSCPCP